MSVLDKILEKAKQDRKRIVLSEGDDPRMTAAARRLIDEGIAVPVLTGAPDKVQAAAAEAGVSLDGIEVIEPVNASRYAEYVEKYTAKRQHKGMTSDKAAAIISDPLYYSAIMVDDGEADGFVAGAVNATANVFRAGLQIIGLAEGIKTASSCFLMVVPDCEYGAEGAFIYSDCGLLPFPDAEQLADIAVASHNSAQALLQTTPYLALLSFSTMSSAEHPNLEKVKQAKQILQQNHPEIKVDGELQADAALVPAIGNSKSPGSSVAGQANVLIFPDLNAGNIAYKLTERLAKATAIGPLPQGFAKPFSDLSRGCNANDIVIASAVVSAQAAGSGTSASSAVPASSEEEIVQVVSDIVAERIRRMMSSN